MAVNLSYGDLVQCCLEVIQSFNPITDAPEDHVNQYLKQFVSTPKYVLYLNFMSVIYKI